MIGQQDNPRAGVEKFASDDEQIFVTTNSFHGLRVADRAKSQQGFMRDRFFVVMLNYALPQLRLRK
ncbi:MAG TPA: hypothetical protein VF439_04015 [Candidatus Paceibacterota bacterium]